MVRQCQSNTCPVGVCTQDPALRAKFTGTADKVVNLMSFYAQEVREVLASVGAKSIDEVIGRADLLTQVSRGAAHLDDLDLNPLLITRRQGEPIDYDRKKPRQRGAGHARRPDRHGRRAVLQGRREDAALLRGAEHAALDRHAGVEPHRAAFRDEERAAARPPDDQARRFGRAVARRVRGAGAEDRGDGRGQRLRRQGAVGRHHRRAAAARLAAGAARERDHRQHRALRRHRRVAVRQRPRRRAVLRAELRAPRWWSRAAARTAAST